MASSTASPWNRYMLLHIIETAGQKVLLYTLQCGVKCNAPTQTLNDYLRFLYPSMRKYLTRMEMEQIISNPPVTKFDIILLYKVIKMVCGQSSFYEPRPPELEHYIQKIKDTRNEVIHYAYQHHDQQTFLNRVAELSQLFVATLEATKDRYGRDNAEYLAKKDEVLSTVEVILEGNFSEIISQVIMNCHSFL